MRRRRIASIFSVLFIVTLCVSLFTACRKMERIEEDQVDKILVWVQNTEEYELTANDSARFIELYNSSKYEGKGTGEGGTPKFGIYVYFRDGSHLCTNDFFGELEVSLYSADGNKKAWYYISSEELYPFVSELANKVEETHK